jgi:hypothetical protein
MAPLLVAVTLQSIPSGARAAPFSMAPETTAALATVNGVVTANRLPARLPGRCTDCAAPVGPVYIGDQRVIRSGWPGRRVPKASPYPAGTVATLDSSARDLCRITKTFTSLVSRDPTQRLRLSVNAFLTYPFSRPGYRFNDVPEDDGRSLDMVRCPVADYLGQRDAADLCAGSWCNLDYALAEMWGGRLQRSSTLVAGAKCCDFRFTPCRPQANIHRRRFANSLSKIGL